MYAPLIPATLDWRDGTPWSADYGDTYHARDGGPGQARHVFLAGNRLPGAWRKRERYVILETGFGAGLNFLTTWTAWRDDPQACGQLHYLAAEKHPFSAADLAVLHAGWPEFAALSSVLREQWPLAVPGFHRLRFAGGRLILTLLFGDALATLGQVNAQVDAFYLDGFAPDRNPALWSVPVFKQLARLAAPHATLATWCVAGPVRRALQDTGFSLEKAPGFGAKREMLRGTLIAPRQRRPARSAGHALLIGAGLAGTAAAAALAQRGWRVSLIEQNAGPAQGASGNPAGIVRPVLSRDDNLAVRFTRAAFLDTLRTWPRLSRPPHRAACGAIHLAADAADAAHQRALIEALQMPAEFATWVDAATASRISGQTLGRGGWFFPAAGWVNPPSLCAAWLTEGGERITALYGTTVARLERGTDGWRAIGTNGAIIAGGDCVILAGGANALDLVPDPHPPLRRMRGQITLLPETAIPGLKTVLCRDGYVIPPVDGLICTGASYDDATDPGLCPATQRNNLRQLDAILPGVTRGFANGLVPGLDGPIPGGRVGFRAIAPDRLPLVGALPATPTAKISGKIGQWPRQDGIYALLGLASRGLVWSGLCGELLACQIGGEPLPIEQRLVDAVDPARFTWRLAVQPV